jgi:hypothetical protein
MHVTLTIYRLNVMLINPSNPMGLKAEIVKKKKHKAARQIEQNK